PTIGVEITRKFQQFIRQRFVIADFGGQVVYRKQHSKRKDLWKRLSAMIFVVDLQDQESFTAARDYLRDIWSVVKKVNKVQPKLSIFLHKYDMSRREELEVNIRECMESFRDFEKISSFHLTTIEDNSANIAMIKTLYFSLPRVMLRRMFEQEFLDYFEKEVLALFTDLSREKKYSTIFAESMQEIRKSAKLIGMNYGLSLQNTWMQYLAGEWIPKSRLMISKTVDIKEKGNDIILTIPDWTDHNIPRNLTTALIDGMLEGILSTFYLNPPEITEERGVFTTWKITL
ncbi:MAG: Rab family GTPase, partial [Candidatus Hodarchaeales archaeon]